MAKNASKSPNVEEKGSTTENGAEGTSNENAGNTAPEQEPEEKGEEPEASAEGNAAPAAEANATEPEDPGHKNPKLDDKNAVGILGKAIEKAFDERAQSSLPKLSERDIKAFAGPAASVVKMDFHYENDEKTKGFITLSEFNVEYRCPENGSYQFNEFNAAYISADSAVDEA